jgi:hypothetical protein
MLRIAKRASANHGRNAKSGIGDSVLARKPFSEKGIYISPSIHKKILTILKRKPMGSFRRKYFDYYPNAILYALLGNPKSGIIDGMFLMKATGAGCTYMPGVRPKEMVEAFMRATKKNRALSAFFRVIRSIESPAPSGRGWESGREGNALYHMNGTPMISGKLGGPRVTVEMRIPTESSVRRLTLFITKKRKDA